MSGRLKGLEGRRILLAFGKSAFAAAVMALALVAWTNQAINQPVWLLVIVGVVLGAGVYGIMILVLGVKEARHLLSSLVQRVRQRI
jgi:predicted DNA repair protein MutK